MDNDMKNYLEWRKLAEPVEKLTGLQAHAYSHAYIIFFDKENKQDYDIPVPFLRVLSAALEERE
jgi:hypothetical protein